MSEEGKENKKPKIKSCPFCDSEVRMFENDSSKRWWVKITCRVNCRAELTKQWNTRA